MIYEWNNMQLNSIQTLFENDKNRGYICQDLASEDSNNYTLIDVYDHELAREVIRAFYGKNMELTDRPSDYDNYRGAILKCFSYEGRMVLLFPYIKARPLKEFYMSQPVTLPECEHICNSFVLACLTAQVPFSFLYVMLTQGQINLAKDSSISLSYAVDLSAFDKTRGEKDCVVECAKIVLDMLEPYSGNKRGRTFSYELLQKRVASSGYQRFTELYKDLTISASSIKKRGILARISAFFEANKDNLFRILLTICIILLIITLLSFITQAIFGDIPWMRVFFAGFKKIGTESMLQ